LLTYFFLSDVFFEAPGGSHCHCPQSPTAEIETVQIRHVRADYIREIRFHNRNCCRSRIRAPGQIVWQNKFRPEMYFQKASSAVELKSPDQLLIVVFSDGRRVANHLPHHGRGLRCRSA
jgi:hypothetical protein